MAEPLINSPVDLANCDNEPIHIPGSVQPHAVLLVLREPELTVAQASANAAENWASLSNKSWALRSAAFFHPRTSTIFANTSCRFPSKPRRIISRRFARGRRNAGWKRSSIATKALSCLNSRTGRTAPR